eukprot:299336-Prorocentrum_minimum.AAC.1
MRASHVRGGAITPPPVGGRAVHPKLRVHHAPGPEPPAPPAFWPPGAGPPGAPWARSGIRTPAGARPGVRAHPPRAGAVAHAVEPWPQPVPAGMWPPQM